MEAMIRLPCWSQLIVLGIHQARSTECTRVYGIKTRKVLHSTYQVETWAAASYHEGLHNLIIFPDSLFR